MQVDYHAKYLKYKQKYLDLKEEMIGSGLNKQGPVKGSNKKEAMKKKECKLPTTVKVKNPGFDPKDYEYTEKDCGKEKINNNLMDPEGMMKRCEYTCDKRFLITKANWKKLMKEEKGLYETVKLEQ